MSIAAMEKQISSIDAGLVLDAMVGRLSYDEDFATAIVKDPRNTLAEAGMIIDKDSVEEFIRTNPERFDMVCDALCRLVSPDFLAAMGPSSCG